MSYSMSCCNVLGAVTQPVAVIIILGNDVQNKIKLKLDIKYTNFEERKVKKNKFKSTVSF